MQDKKLAEIEEAVVKLQEDLSRLRMEYEASIQWDMHFSVIMESRVRRIEELLGGAAAGLG